MLRSGAGDQLLTEFVEIESGKRADWPQLAAATDAAKKQGARLLIAKLDRLSRNVSFIFSLRHAWSYVLAPADGAVERHGWQCLDLARSHPFVVLNDRLFSKL